jgi:hypothetical protein
MHFKGPTSLTRYENLHGSRRDTVGDDHQFARARLLAGWHIETSRPGRRYAVSDPTLW